MKFSPRALLPAIDGPDNGIRNLWDRLRTVPLGNKLFDSLIGRLIPYTGSITPEVLELRRGFAKVRMKDRHALRNHLSSIHAIALSNLAEYTGNLALAYSLPDGARFIVKSMRMDYLKKARGPIVATSECPDIPNPDRRELEITVALLDDSLDKVAEATLTTLVGPIPKR
jgi:acyl-coenzyme A thioesterase PaaI-like protein